ncbi:MAG: glutamate--tRNA ligase, partial [Pseudomonadota bacterium]
MSNNKPHQVITRFAPSPTGDLHIGGARTALFNYLFAKRHNGKFLLRIEDTDKARSTPQAVAAILDGMAWLGLEADEPPIYQAQRANRHAEVAHELIASGKAFKCYLTPEQATIQREKAMAAGHAFRSPYRDGDHQNNVSPFVVRLRAPDDEVAIIIDDKVQGQVRTMGKDLDDMVLLRTDDSPTYMLAVVVDDYDMRITHVIRGDDHLTNAARQSVLIDALGWQRPI